MIENGYVFGFIVAIFIIGCIVNFSRIFFPNYTIKQYMSSKWKMPNDNYTRFGGLIFLGIYAYVLLYLLGYIK